MPRDPEKARAARQRYRTRKHIEQYGLGAGDQRGIHDNHTERGRDDATGQFKPRHPTKGGK